MHSWTTYIIKYEVEKSKQLSLFENKSRMVGWLFRFYGIWTLAGYLTPNPFLCKKLYFKQFSLAGVHSLIVKNILFHAIQFNQTVLSQLIQFSISTDFVYTLLNVKSSILNYSVLRKYSFNVKSSSISNNSV